MAIENIDACPAPIEEMIDCVGGIESIVLDGTRLYFGFGYDIVITPLIRDQEAIAVFASKYMEQLDGKHDLDYWRELAQYSIEYSDLTGDDDDARSFSSEQMRLAAEQLYIAETRNVAIPSFEFKDHINYLLLAACEWPSTFEEREIAEPLKRLGLDFEELSWDVLDETISFLRGKNELPEGASYSDAALVIRGHLDRLLDKALANWGTIFSALRRFENV